MKGNKLPYTAILGMLIMLIIKSHGCATPHKHVMQISLERFVIYNKMVKIREFGESDMEH